MICLIDGQRLQIEHGDGHVAAVGRKTVTGLGRDARAVHAGRVLDVAEHFAGGASTTIMWVAAGDEHAARGGFRPRRSPCRLRP